MTFFEGFDEWDLELPTGVTLHGRSGGHGPAVVLLHGHPRAHTTWYQAAPRLAAAGYTVICPDVRGHGRSSKPAPDDGHRAHCAAAKAADTVELARAAGPVTTARVDSGHHMAEENPAEVAAALVGFLGASLPPRTSR